MLNNQYSNSILLYGKHSVIAAICNKNRKIFSIMVLKQHFEEMRSILINSRPNILPKLKITNKLKFEELFPNDNIVHQGFAVHCTKKSTGDIYDLLEQSKSYSSYNVIILDKVTDTRNIGSIIRSAIAFNIDTIIISNNLYTENALLVKTAVGAFEKINIILSKNLHDTVKLLKQNKFWIIGLNPTANKNLSELNNFPKKALILGSENTGISQLIEKQCDLLLRINISSDVDSLNISNAAAIVFYEINNI